MSERKRKKRKRGNDNTIPQRIIFHFNGMEKNKGTERERKKW